MARLNLKLRLILGIAVSMLPLLVLQLIFSMVFSNLVDNLENRSRDSLDEVMPVAGLELLLPLLMLAALGIVFLTSCYLIRAVIEPVRELERGAQKLADGDLSYRVKVGSGDELGDLARSFNRMAEKLQTSYQTLEGLSSLDYLTGLANVREFYRVYHEEIRRAERYQHPLSLLILDVDNFKQVNDRHGHQVGDLVLQEVGRNLSELVRSSDHVARIGGDEFAILFPETGRLQAQELGDRIRSFFADHRMDDVACAEGPLQVTISLGLGGYPLDSAEANELFALTDQALYRSKQAGRNRLSLAAANGRDPVFHDS